MVKKTISSKKKAHKCADGITRNLVFFEKETKRVGKEWHIRGGGCEEIEDLKVFTAMKRGERVVLEA